MTEDVKQVMQVREGRRSSSSQWFDHMQRRKCCRGGSTSAVVDVPSVCCVPEKLAFNRLGGAIKDFLEERRLRALSGNTLRMYEDALNRLQGHLGADKRIEEIHLEDLKGYMRAEESRGLSRKTMKTRTQCVKSFFRWLVDNEFIEKDPSRRLPQIRLEDKVLPPLSVQQVQAILDGIKQERIEGVRDRLLILLLADSGARVSEAIGIKLEDVNLDAKRVKIMGKGAKERYLRLSHVTKLELGRYLRKLPAARNQEMRFLFENPDTCQPITRGTAHRIVRRHAENVGIAGVHPHQFRRSFTSEYISSGGDIFTLQKELGHSDLQMVRKYASIYDPDVDRKHQEYGLGGKLRVSKGRKT